MNDLNDKPYPIYRIFLGYFILGGLIGTLIFSAIYNLIEFIDTGRNMFLEYILSFIAWGYICAFVPSLLIFIKAVRDKWRLLVNVNYRDLLLEGAKVSMIFWIFFVPVLGLIFTNLKISIFLLFHIVLIAFTGAITNLVIGYLTLPKRH